MIARIWHGWTTRANADVHEALDEVIVNAGSGGSSVGG